MRIKNNSDSVIIVLHEIYGINQHIKMVCKKLSIKGYDIICPDLIKSGKPFNYDMQEEAYKHFINNVGFESAFEQVKKLIVKVKKQYKHVYLIGYSIGATIAWMCSGEENMCDGIIGYYGSRIRDYVNINPQCPVLLIFGDEEKLFNVQKLIDMLKKKNINVYKLSGKHGFADKFSENYCEKSSQEAEIFTFKFLERLKA